MTAPRRTRPRWVAAVAGVIGIAVGGAVLVASDNMASAEKWRKSIDRFDRVSSAGWSGGETGSWRLSGAPSAAFRIAHDKGTIQLRGDGSRPTAVLATPAVGASIVTTMVSTSELVAGSSVTVHVLGRVSKSGSSYSAGVTLTPNAPASVVLERTNAGGRATPLTSKRALPDVTPAPGQRLKIRLKVAGSSPTTLGVKVWERSDSRPTSWITARDAAPALQGSGHVGVSAELRSQGTVPTEATLYVSNFHTKIRTTPRVDKGPNRDPKPSSKPLTNVTHGRAASTAGSAPVGSTRYGVQRNAVYVSPNGKDTNSGSRGAPLASLGRAIATAPSGGQIVLRAGTYHESVTVPANKRLTIQSAPGERVWLDGSVPVRGWHSDGNAWREDGWTARFDSSPTYTQGAADSKVANWSFVSSTYPMASHPDQVWVDGVAQRQVSSRSQVRPGTFFVDVPGRHLFLGSDPTAKDVRASTLETALTINSSGTVLRGIGIRRYATPVPQMGTLRLRGPHITVENVVVADNATQGITALAPNILLRKVTAVHNGLMGVHANRADGLRLVRVRASENNSEHFNMAPSSGGFKVCSTRGLHVTSSAFVDNYGPGIWLDCSVYDATLVGNDTIGNAGHGMILEISAKAVVADNRIMNNGGTGIKVNDTSSVQLWNNTIIDNTGKPMWLVQDSRTAAQLSVPGHDTRRPLPDPTMSWLLGPLVVHNNVIGGTRADCLLCLEDNALHRSASTIGVSADGNLYYRSSASQPRWVAVWANGGRNPEVYTTLSDFKRSTGQEPHGRQFNGSSIVTPSGTLTNRVSRGNPVPLPPGIAKLVGQPARSHHTGAWF